MANIESITSEILSSKDCEAVLKKSVGSSSKLITFQVGKLSDKVVGFLGDHFRLIIKYQRDDGQQLTASYFLKTLPKFNDYHLKYVEQMGVFKKECLVYENLLSDFSKFTKIPFAPTCYYISKSYDCIILEDMTTKGFKNFHKEDYLTLEQIILVIKTIARFHASTIIYEEKKGENYRLSSNFTEELKEGTFSYVEGHPRQKWCVCVTKCLSDCIKLVPGVKNPQDVCEKLHKFVFGEIPKLLKPSKRFRNVLNHDDLWCNNMMFNENDCVLVDFQLVRYTPPAFDFLAALRINLEENCVKENFSKLINVYYDTFKKELERHHLIPEELLSKDEFIQSLKSYELVTLTEACMYGTNVYISNELSDIIVSDQEHFNEFFFIDRSKYIVKEYQENSRFRNRLLNVLAPLIEKLQKM